MSFLATVDLTLVTVGHLAITLAERAEIPCLCRVVVLRPADATQRDSFLVRPDGHLGWRGNSPAAMGNWLRRALGAGRVR